MFNNRDEFLDALSRRKHLDRLRAFALSSTENFAKVCGLNPWNLDDLDNPYPACDEKLMFYPWCPYLDDTASYLDKKPLDENGGRLAKPIKPVFIGRDHFKTTACEVALARRGILNPYQNNIIFCDNEDKASIRLNHIADIYQNEVIQELFSDVLHPAGTNSRFFYNNSEIYLKRDRQQKRPTFEIFGLRTATAGYHFNGVVWADDLVNDNNYKSVEIQESIWLKLQQVIKYVASPGCEIWISGTRYILTDAYSYILDDDSPLAHDIVPGAILLGCFDEDEAGKRQALNFFRFCWDEKDTTKYVIFHDKNFYPVRESLEVKKSTTEPVSEWYSQMENNPISVENAAFSKEQFQKIIPCKASKLKEWIKDPVNIRNYVLCASHDADVGREKLNRAELRVAIAGDLAYKANRRNDFSVALVVGQDANDDWYLMDGWRGKTDVDAGGLNLYFRHVYNFRDKYGVSLPLGIETHAKESTRAAAKMIANNIGVNHPIFHPLKDNSGGRGGMKKEVRIADALESHLSAGKLYVCEDFPKNVLAALLEEAMTYPNGRHDDVLDSLANFRQVFAPRRIASSKKIDMIKRHRLNNRLLRRAV